MSDQANDLIESAVKKNYILQGQADLLKEELAMFPGAGNVLSIMMRRGMLSPDQAKSLEAVQLAQGSSEPPEESNSELDLESLDDFEIIPPPAYGVQRGMETTLQATGTYQTPRESVNPYRPLPSIAVNPPAPSFSEAPPARAQRSVADALGEARKALHSVTVKSNSAHFDPDPYMIKLLKKGRELGCSDLHITVKKPPYMRIEGKLVFLSEDPITAELAHRLIFSVLTNEQQAEFEREKQVDFSFECKGAGRFRANVYQQRIGTEGAFRLISETVPTLASLKLPAVLEKLTTYPQGLNLVTGPGGCGKTSTVAAMLEYINCHRHDHIITVEDPVEIVFQPKNCQITQREVGTHTESFATALRTALRQDPDVIMIGELRDLETTSISITAAETGHLVFGTLHTSSAARTVARILDVYPPAQRPQICMMVAESLRGIVSQQLLPKKDGRGRVCAMEILLVTTGVAQMIKEGKTHQLVSHMQSGRKLGMMSMDDALLELCQSDLISGSVAWSNAENKSLFEGLRTKP